MVGSKTSLIRILLTISLLCCPCAQASDAIADTHSTYELALEAVGELGFDLVYAVRVTRAPRRDRAIEAIATSNAELGGRLAILAKAYDALEAARRDQESYPGNTEVKWVASPQSQQSGASPAREHVEPSLIDSGGVIPHCPTFTQHFLNLHRQPFSKDQRTLRAAHPIRAD